MILLERIEEKISREPMSGCWIWTGALSGGGYAQAGINRKTVYVHRLAYEAFRGCVPAGQTIDHLCRVRCCVNPWHMEAVSPRENVLRGVSAPAMLARKTHCKYGHLLSGPNLYLMPRGQGRQCRKCRYDRNTRGRAARYAAARLP